jgi:hypothetical protein
VAVALEQRSNRSSLTRIEFVRNDTSHSENIAEDLLIGLLMDSKLSIPFYVLICFPNLKLGTSLQHDNAREKDFR